MPLHLVNGKRAVRFSPDLNSPQLTMGHGSNVVSASGGAIAGGGNTTFPQFVGGDCSFAAGQGA